MLEVLYTVTVFIFVLLAIDTLALHGIVEDTFWELLCFLWYKMCLFYWLAYKEFYTYLIYKRYKKSIEYRGQSFSSFKFQRQERIGRGIDE